MLIDLTSDGAVKRLLSLTLNFATGPTSTLRLASADKVLQLEFGLRGQRSGKFKDLTLGIDN